MAAPIGVVILNMGGPASEAEVPVFLRRLLSDPDMMPVPWPLRPWLARRIARRRGPAVAGHYRIIGGSPIQRETQAQVEALGKVLGPGFVVRHAFRYSAPSANEALDQLAAAGITRLIGLPAHPQWSQATSGSALTDLSRAAGRRKIEVSGIRSFPEGPGYISALADSTRPLLQYTGHLIFSAHGLPQRMVNNGDPYPEEVGRTAGALAEALGSGVPHSLAYQSRVGKMEWTRPYLVDEVVRLGAEGVTSLVVVPLSFACENLETLYELDIQTAELARSCGITTYRRAPAPGCHPDFIGELAGLVRQQAESTGWGE
jgi:ferrochelatase